MARQNKRTAQQTNTHHSIMKSLSPSLRLPRQLVAVGLVFTLLGCAPGMTAMAEKSPLPRQENPSIYPYPNVPPPKFPEAPADSGYRPGMTSKDYFLELCQREAGEFIYKTVE